MARNLGQYGGSPFELPPVDQYQPGSILAQAISNFPQQWMQMKMYADAQEQERLMDKRRLDITEQHYKDQTAYQRFNALGSVFGDFGKYFPEEYSKLLLGSGFLKENMGTDYTNASPEAKDSMNNEIHTMSGLFTRTREIDQTLENIEKRLANPANFSTTGFWEGIDTDLNRIPDSEIKRDFIKKSVLPKQETWNTQILKDTQEDNYIDIMSSVFPEYPDITSASKKGYYSSASQFNQVLTAKIGSDEASKKRLISANDKIDDRIKNIYTPEQTDTYAKQAEREFDNRALETIIPYKTGASKLPPAGTDRAEWVSQRLGALQGYAGKQLTDAKATIKAIGESKGWDIYTGMQIGTPVPDEPPPPPPPPPPLGGKGFSDIEVQALKNVIARNPNLYDGNVLKPEYASKKAVIDVQSKQLKEEIERLTTAVPALKKPVRPPFEPLLPEEAELEPDIDVPPIDSAFTAPTTQLSEEELQEALGTTMYRTGQSGAEQYLEKGPDVEITDTEEESARFRGEHGAVDTVTVKPDITSVADTVTVKPDTVFTDEDEYEPLFDIPIPEEPEPEEILDLKDKVESNRAEDIRLKREAARLDREEKRRLLKEKQEEQRLAGIERRKTRAVERKERTAELKAKYDDLAKARKEGRVEKPTLKEIVTGAARGRADSLREIDILAMESVPFTSILWRNSNKNKLYSNKNNTTASVAGFDVTLPLGADLSRILEPGSEKIMDYVRMTVDVNGKKVKLHGRKIKDYSIGLEGERKNLYDYIYQNIARQIAEQKK